MRLRFRPDLIQPSTRAFAREAQRTPGYSLFDWLHGYIYGRWLYLYVSLGTGGHPVARVLGPVILWLGRLFPSRGSDAPESGQKSSIRTFADTYHGKVVTLEAAVQLVSIKEDLSLTNLEQVIPYALARDIVLQHPEHIAVLECPCRAARSNPCQPIDVCLVVGEPFASFITEHHPRRARWITPDEAVDILRAEHERGHVHHAFFKDAMLGRFYAICNCCTCCCGAIQAHRQGLPMLASSGYVSCVEEELCLGCGLCAESCQFGTLSIHDGMAVVNASACMGCGVCVSVCAAGALSLRRDPVRGEPLEINRLLESAAQAAPKG
jgi:ferredoxin